MRDPATYAGSNKNDIRTATSLRGIWDRLFDDEFLNEFLQISQGYDLDQTFNLPFRWN